TLKSGHGVWVARLGMAAIFSLPLFAVWALLDHGVPGSVQKLRLLLTLGTIMVMGAMVIIKQHVLDRELLSLLRASQNSFEDLKRLQAQLVQSEKLASLGQLVGGAAHELNNPLTAMLGYADLLACSPLNEEQRSLADKIGHQARRTKALVASLLSFARQRPGSTTTGAGIRSFLYHQAGRPGNGARPECLLRHRAGTQGQNFLSQPSRGRRGVSHRTSCHQPHRLPCRSEGGGSGRWTVPV